MDIEYLLVLRDFREGAGQFLRELFMKLTESRFFRLFFIAMMTD
jgi:hypothetical protein